jgi:hypothetical protein
MREPEAKRAIRKSAGAALQPSKEAMACACGNPSHLRWPRLSVGTRSLVCTGFRSQTHHPGDNRDYQMGKMRPRERQEIP